jgi:hypothetical protein
MAVRFLVNPRGYQKPAFRPEGQMTCQSQIARESRLLPD